MNYFWMFCDFDKRHELWLFFEYQAKLTVLERFRDFACPKCGKVEEFKAIDAGPPVIKAVKTKKNIVKSYDGMLCMDATASDLFKKLAGQDIEFVPISDNGWNVVKPVRRIKVRDPKRAGMLVLRECSVCHRPRELKRWPKKQDLLWPRKPFHFALLEPCLEGYNGRAVLFLVSQKVVDVVNDKKITGPYFRPLIDTES
jgi:hypothetical protein